jgi:hypothetical protein
VLFSVRFDANGVARHGAAQPLLRYVCHQPNGSTVMPEKATLKRAAADKRAGKSSSTQAGEFVKEEVDHVREGKHGVRSAKQAIAIGLSKARRAGVALKQPKAGTTSEATRKKAAADTAAGQKKTSAKKSTAATKSTAAKKATTAKKTATARRPSSESTAKRSRVSEAVLKRESGQGASKQALSKQTRAAAARRPAASRSAAAKKAAATKGAAGRSAAAKKAAHTRAARAHH